MISAPDHVAARVGREEEDDLRDLIGLSDSA